MNIKVAEMKKITFENLDGLKAVMAVFPHPINDTVRCKVEQFGLEGADEQGNLVDRGYCYKITCEIKNGGLKGWGVMAEIFNQKDCDIYQLSWKLTKAGVFAKK